MTCVGVGTEYRRPNLRTPEVPRAEQSTQRQLSLSWRRRQEGNASSVAASPSPGFGVLVAPSPALAKPSTSRPSSRAGTQDVAPSSQRPRPHSAMSAPVPGFRPCAIKLTEGKHLFLPKEFYDEPDPWAAPPEKDRRCAVARPPWAGCALKFSTQNEFSEGTVEGSVALFGTSPVPDKRYVSAPSPVPAAPALAADRAQDQILAQDSRVVDQKKAVNHRIPSTSRVHTLELSVLLNLDQPAPRPASTELVTKVEGTDDRASAAIGRLLGHSQARSFPRKAPRALRDIAAIDSGSYISRESPGIVRQSPPSDCASLTARTLHDGHYSEQQRANPEYDHQVRSSKKGCEALAWPSSASSRQSAPVGGATCADAPPATGRTTSMPTPSTIKFKKTATVIKGINALKPRNKHDPDLEIAMRELYVSHKSNQIVSLKLKAFDRRFMETEKKKKPAEHDVDVEFDKDIDSTTGLEPVTGPSAADRIDFNIPAESANDQRIEGEDANVKRKHLAYEIVKWSCQKSDCRADSLKKHGGRWETIPGKVRNEYLVFELVGLQPAATISSIELKLAGCDYAPHAFMLEYSKDSAEGPWTEAWKFSAEQKEDAYLFSSFDYLKVVIDFKNLLTILFDGGVEEAWKEMLDKDGDGKLSVSEFTHAMLTLKEVIRAMPAQKKGRVQKFAHVFRDPRKLFMALDIDKSGAVELEDLLLEDENFLAPEAVWWKLTVINNWGNPKRLQMLGPIVLSQKVKTETFKELGKCFRNDPDVIGCSCNDLAKAFDTKLLEVDAALMNVRRLAKKYEVKLSLAESIYDYFKNVDTDGSGAIEECEFHQLLLKIYGAADPSDLPKTRLHTFWQQADKNGSGALDFEEFFTWFLKHFVAEGTKGNMNPSNMVDALHNKLGGKRRHAQGSRRTSTSQEYDSSRSRQ